MNSLLIRGKEPILVDTGAPANRDEWLRNVSSLVELQDVRWIFLSHDDRDHSGNLLAVLDACPKATLLTTWFMVGRMFEEWPTPLPRCRFLRDGESFDAGDRDLTAVRPPLFDNPTSRGLFDQRTGVYWAVDTFATPLPQPLTDLAELPDAAFEEGQLLGNRLIAPWHAWLDEAKFRAQVRRVQELPISTIASCHAPAMSGARLRRAFELLRRMPGLDAWTEYGQHDLELWLSHAGVVQ